MSDVCPECRTTNDVLCVTLGKTRVLAMDAAGHVRLFTADPSAVEGARQMVQGQIERLEAVISEAIQKAHLYVHLRDTLALAVRPTVKGAKA